ncbi:hypothetical protein [Martelella mediterranea]|uniref:SH3 domain-containing protein n=1 Tax=Martelella mediterranea DSM 17316 TaxID=1122214 RepID=A0A1U9Z5Y9_9HYPH|nr:hypothetical protein [Martelella mediterranea]AQZ52992.1 hypothetical protein Mame_03687 [Martelella mediterranea DSM 17316]
MAAIAAAFALLASVAQAEIDGSGPDAWRVTGVAPNDVLNVRMGPGAGYPVIATFAHDQRELQQITCVPFYTMAHFSAMTEAELDALPPRWCLMRTADLATAGWVAQRYLIVDFDDDILFGNSGAHEEQEEVVDVEKILPAPTTGPQAWSGDDLIEHARALVAALYDYDDHGVGLSHRDPSAPDVFFSTGFRNALRSRPPGADLLIGAQDFQGSVSEPVPDPDQPMFRGMITINVEVENFGKTHTAVFRLRGDATRPDAPLRIFRIEHDGWSYP